MQKWEEGLLSCVWFVSGGGGKRDVLWSLLCSRGGWWVAGGKITDSLAAVATLPVDPELLLVLHRDDNTAYVDNIDGKSTIHSKHISIFSSFEYKGQLGLSLVQKISSTTDRQSAIIYKVIRDDIRVEETGDMCCGDMETECHECVVSQVDLVMMTTGIR